MRFKGTKDQLRANLVNKVYSGMKVMPPYQIDGPVYRELANNINMVIEMKLTEVIDELVDNLYGDEEFEQDIGLKS